MRGLFDFSIRILKEALEKLHIDDTCSICDVPCLIADVEVAIRILEAAEKGAIIKHKGFPTIVCLCGSTRFVDMMLIKQWELTKQGNIVLSWCALPDWYWKGEDKAHIGDQEGVKEAMDELHKRKIDLADEVFILNFGGYVGESTRSEIKYALENGKPVRWLEQSSAEAILRAIGL